MKHVTSACIILILVFSVIFSVIAEANPEDMNAVGDGALSNEALDTNEADNIDSVPVPIDERAEALGVVFSELFKQTPEVISLILGLNVVDVVEAEVLTSGDVAQLNQKFNYLPYGIASSNTHLIIDSAKINAIFAGIPEFELTRTSDVVNIDMTVPYITMSADTPSMVTVVLWFKEDGSLIAKYNDYCSENGVYYISDPGTVDYNAVIDYLNKNV